MVKRKKKSEPEYDFLFLTLSRYEISVDNTINYEVRDKRHYRDDAKVFNFDTSIELYGVFSYPEELKGQNLYLMIYGSENSHKDFNLTLADCHVRDENDLPRYKKIRGKETPIYNVPKGLGYFERRRGTKEWSGVVWVSHRSSSDMMTLLTNVKSLYIMIHEHKIERVRWINGLTLQTSNPDEE